MAYKALMNCSVELISMISVGRLFHSLMVLGKNTLLGCSGENYWCYKVIQMVLSSRILCCCAVQWHLYGWGSYYTY